MGKTAVMEIQDLTVIRVETVTTGRRENREIQVKTGNLEIQVRRETMDPPAGLEILAKTVKKETRDKLVRIPCPRN